MDQCEPERLPAVNYVRIAVGDIVQALLDPHVAVELVADHMRMTASRREA